MPLRKTRRALFLALPFISLLLMLTVAWHWRRSHTIIDQLQYATHTFESAPLSGPPPMYWPDETPPDPNTVFWPGRYREFRIDTFHGRIILRFGHRPTILADKKIPPNLQNELGYHRSTLTIDNAIGYNIPRGNVYEYRESWHWNGIATWPYYINGDAATYVMLPHWLMMLLAAAPALLWLSVLGIRRLRRPGPGICPHCRYERGDLPGPCPECGNTEQPPPISTH